MSNLVDKPVVEHIFMLNAQGGYGPVVKSEGFERYDRHDYYASDTSYDSDNSTQNAAIVRASDFDYDYVPPEIKVPDITLVCTTCGTQSTEETTALQCRSAKCHAWCWDPFPLEATRRPRVYARRAGLLNRASRANCQARTSARLQGTRSNRPSATDCSPGQQNACKGNTQESTAIQHDTATSTRMQTPGGTWHPCCCAHRKSTQAR
jgi:hypothetical protein